MPTGDTPQGTDIVDAEFKETGSDSGRLAPKPGRRARKSTAPTLLEVIRDLAEKHPEIVQVLAADLAERRKGDREDRRNSKLLVAFIAAGCFYVSAHVGGAYAVGIVSAMMTGMFGVSDNGRAAGRAVLRKLKWLPRNDDDDDDPDMPALTAGPMRARD